MTLEKRAYLTIGFLTIKFCRHGNRFCAETMQAMGLE